MPHTSASILPETTDRVAEALFGQTRRRLLALFLGRPTESFYLREIVRKTRTGTGSVQRELQRLLAAGLITRTKTGNQVHYRANPNSPVYRDLQSLLSKTAGLADVLRDALRNVRRRRFIKLAFVYGSAAAGRQSSDSDIDLMVVGSLDIADLLPMLHEAQHDLNREINPTIYHPTEFKRRAQSRGHLIARVLAAPRIMLIGTDDDLEKLAGKPLDRGS